MLSTETIEALYSSKGRTASKPRKSKGRAFTSEGWQELTSTSNGILGAFEGNVGTTKRSRRGRSYKLPNGRRYYVNGSSEVLAYVLK